MSQTDKKVAYIVISYNNQDILKECFDSIYSQTYKKKKVILLDNDSKDNSVEVVRKNFPDTEIIESKVNTGFAGGNNIAINYALKDPDVDYIVLLNSDAQLANDWTETVVNFAKNKPNGACFQTITLDYYNHEIIDSTHIYLAHSGQANQGSWRRTLPKGFDAPAYKTYGCNAAAVLYTRRFIEEQPFDHFFDERMFMYLEDVDIATRAVVLGWDNFVVPGSKAYHMGSVSSGKNPGFSLYMTYRNNSALFFKNFPVSLILFFIPRIIKSDYQTIKSLLKMNKRRQAWFLIKGRVNGIFRCFLYTNKRLIINKNRKITNKSLKAIMARGYYV